MSNFSKEFYHWLAVGYNEAQWHGGSPPFLKWRVTRKFGAGVPLLPTGAIRRAIRALAPERSRITVSYGLICVVFGLALTLAIPSGFDVIAVIHCCAFVIYHFTFVL